jgi:hypothetical protein
MDSKNLDAFDRGIRIALGLFLIGLVVLQPLPLNTTLMLVFAVMGLGMMAEALNQGY